MAYSELANWDGSLTKTFQQQRRCGPGTTLSNNGINNMTMPEKAYHAGTPSSSSSVQIIDDLLTQRGVSVEQLPATSTLSVSMSLADELFPEAKTSLADNDSAAPSQTNPSFLPPPTPPTPPPDPVVPSKRKRGKPTKKDSAASVDADSILVETSATRRRNPDPQSRSSGLKKEPYIELPSLGSLGHSRDSYRSLALWFSEGRCQDFFGDVEDAAVQSASGSSKREQSSVANAQTVTHHIKEEEPDSLESIESDEEAPSETESYLELVALDAYCHHCRRRNRYAKMKCTKILGKGIVCQMEFCHLCIYQRYPDIEFEPFSRNFLCPRCQGTCNCSSCCMKRNEKYFQTPKRNIPPVHLLYLSELGRRQQEAEQQGKGKKKVKKKVKGDRRPGLKSGSTRHQVNKPALIPSDIGSEAQEWISSHLGEFARSGSAAQRPRVFVGDWQESWGRMAEDPASVSMVCVDIPVGSSSDPAGKGKGRAIEPLARMYVGDRDGMYKTFKSIDDIEETAEKGRRTRKPSAKARGDAAVDDNPPKKKRGRPPKPKGIQGPVPEFTINHQENKTSDLGIKSFLNHLQPGNGLSLWGDETPEEFGPGFDWERNDVVLPPISPYKASDNVTSFDEQYRAAFEEYMLPTASHNDVLLQHGGFDSNVYNLDSHSHFNDFNYAHGLQPSSVDPTLGQILDAIDPALLPLPFSSPKAPRFDIPSPSIPPHSLDPAFLTGPAEESIAVDPVIGDDQSPCPSSPKSVALSYSQVEYAIRNAFQAARH